MNSSKNNQIAANTKHVHNKQTTNPLIYDEPETTLATVSNIMDYLLTANEYMEGHIQDSTHNMHFVVARETLIKLSKEAIDYEAHRIATTFQEVTP